MGIYERHPAGADAPAAGLCLADPDWSQYIGEAQDRAGFRSDQGGQDIATRGPPNTASFYPALPVAKPVEVAVL